MIFEMMVCVVVGVFLPVFLVDFGWWLISEITHVHRGYVKWLLKNDWEMMFRVYLSDRGIYPR